MALDVYRLLQRFRPAIERWPLQTYASSLVFSPTQSLVRGQFHREEPQWVRRITKIADQWSACEATLEGHISWVNSAAFSMDGQRIASASDDKTAKIWNVKTGACEVTLEGHTESIRSVAFSADGKCIVSASDDKTIKLWKVHTGLC